MNFFKGYIFKSEYQDEKNELQPGGFLAKILKLQLFCYFLVADFMPLILFLALKIMEEWIINNKNSDIQVPSINLMPWYS